MPKKTENPLEIQAEAIAFRKTFNTMLLASSDTDGKNDCSYAPYLADEEGHLYIFVSQLALHTRNLSSNANLGVMFIQDESDCRNLFARKRLTLSSTVTKIEPDNERFDITLDKLAEVHGKMIGMLRTLPDFQLFEIEPREGRFVRGFGDAWELKGPELDVIALSRG